MILPLESVSKPEVLDVTNRPLDPIGVCESSLNLFTGKSLADAFVTHDLAESYLPLLLSMGF